MCSALSDVRNCERVPRNDPYTLIKQRSLFLSQIFLGTPHPSEARTWAETLTLGPAGGNTLDWWKLHSPELSGQFSSITNAFHRVACSYLSVNFCYEDVSSCSGNSVKFPLPSKQYFSFLQDLISDSRSYPANRLSIQTACGQ